MFSPSELQAFSLACRQLTPLSLPTLIDGSGMNARAHSGKCLE